MRRIRISFDVVTPESAEHGDFAETGWEDEEGIEIAPDELDIEEHETELAAVCALAVKQIGRGLEPSSSDFGPRIWYTETDSDID